MTPPIRRCALLSNVTPSGKYLKDDGTVDTPGTGPGSGGDVVGPASATDNAITRFNSTTGKLVQDSLVTVDDNGSVNVPTGQAYKINGTALAAGNVGAAPSGEGVTNGNSHDHTGGAGAQIDHTGLSNIGTNTHSTIDTHLGAAAPHSGHSIGIASVTDNVVPRFDGTGGKQLQASAVTIDDTTGLIKINAHSAVADPGASPSGKFLRDDGTWQTNPSGGGGVGSSLFLYANILGGL